MCGAELKLPQVKEEASLLASGYAKGFLILSEMCSSCSLALKGPVAMENNPRYRLASGKCITERLHKQPQRGTQAQTDAGSRKFCVYSVLFDSFNNNYLWKLRFGQEFEGRAEKTQRKQRGRLQRCQRCALERSETHLTPLWQSGIFVLTLNLCRLLAETCN